MARAFLKKFNQVEMYLYHLKSLLNPQGQILVDSSDIAYIYNKDELDDLKKLRYYGELDYFLKYKDDYEFPLTWLYLDFETLSLNCKTVGLTCTKTWEGEHFDYLAKLSLG